MSRRIQFLDTPSAGVAFVWSVWALMLAMALFYVAFFSRNVPYYDGWSMVYVLAGTQPVDATWLWDARNGHRIAIPKLLLLGAYKLSGWDFRAGMYCNVALLGVLSAAMIREAGRLRGGVRCTDVFFPLLLLNWGHYQNLLWSWQLTQVFPVVVAGWLLVMMVRSACEPSLRTIVVAGLCLITLPLSGVVGLAFAPGVALWLFESGRRRWMVGGKRWCRDALIPWGFAGVGLALVAAYFVGLRNTSVAAPDLMRTVKTVIRFLAHGFGPAASSLRPFSSIGMMGLLVVSVAVLLRSLRDFRPENRSRGWALLFFGVASAGIALSVGVARPGSSFPPRYFLFAAPVLCWTYFTWDTCAAPAVARRARTLLVAVGILASAFNGFVGYQYASNRKSQLLAFERDLLDGMPPSRLIALHQRTLLPFPEDGGAYWHESLRFCFEVLRRTGIGRFAFLAAESSFREIPVSEVSALSAAAPVTEAGGDGSPVPDAVWKLERATKLAGMRILRPDAGDGIERVSGHMLTVYWKSSDGGPFSDQRSYVHWWTPEETETTFWIYEDVLELAIAWDSADDGESSAGMQIPECLLLIEDRDTSAGAAR